VIVLRTMLVTASSRPEGGQGRDLSRCCRKARDFPLETSSQFNLLDLKVVMCLQVQPGSCRGTQVPGQSERGIRCDRTRPVDDFIDTGGGTRISLASRYWLIPKGLRNSSNRTSPGGTGGSFAACGLRVVICNLDFIGISVPPAETNPPLIVDADAVLPLIPRVDVPEREQSQGRGPHRLPCDNTQSNASVRHNTESSQTSLAGGWDTWRGTRQRDQGCRTGPVVRDDRGSRGQPSPRSSSGVPSPALLLARDMSFRRRNHPARPNVSQSSL